MSDSSRWRHLPTITSSISRYTLWKLVGKTRQQIAVSPVTNTPICPVYSARFPRCPSAAFISELAVDASISAENSNSASTSHAVIFDLPYLISLCASFLLPVFSVYLRHLLQRQPINHPVRKMHISRPTANFRLFTTRCTLTTQGMISVALMRDEDDDFQADMDSVNFFLHLSLFTVWAESNTSTNANHRQTYTRTYT